PRAVQTRPRTRHLRQVIVSPEEQAARKPGLPECPERGGIIGASRPQVNDNSRPVTPGRMGKKGRGGKASGRQEPGPGRARRGGPRAPVLDGTVVCKGKPYGPRSPRVPPADLRRAARLRTLSDTRTPLERRKYDHDRTRTDRSGQALTADV